MFRLKLERKNRTINQANIFLSVLVCMVLYSATAYAVQTCNDKITKSGADNRYLNPSDGTIIDLQTGLMWQQCSIGQSGVDCGGVVSDLTWAQALQEPVTNNSNSGFAGFNDWRLPNHNELFSLIEIACSLPSINLTIFPNTPGLSFWSSSPYGLTTASWVVYFGYGISTVDKRTVAYPVRLVRSVN